MNFKFLIKNVINIILNPVKAWETIYYENKPVSYLIWNLFLPLTTLTAISAFLGSILFTGTGLTKAYSILAGVRYLLLFLLTLYGTALIFREITNAFNLGRNFSLSFKIIAYSVIPFFICQIASLIFESFIFINILALSGLYICWTGMEKLLNPPEKQKVPLLIAATVAFVVLFIAINWILNIAADKFYFAFFA
jgi:hypothetical protein